MGANEGEDAIPKSGRLTALNDREPKRLPDSVFCHQVARQSNHSPSSPCLKPVILPPPCCRRQTRVFVKPARFAARLRETRQSDSRCLSSKPQHARPRAGQYVAGWLNCQNNGACRWPRRYRVGFSHTAWQTHTIVGPSWQDKRSNFRPSTRCGSMHGNVFISRTPRSKWRANWA